ncbi:patched domain-containing protein 3-like [Centruroides vittatus]|uniref:patched domain-containing protein 3-like n=1 Tax=Centruroides vittatus TaxID=120091 RepID=UPI00350F76CA
MHNSKMKLDCVARFFSSRFKQLGGSIADNPSYYVIIPVAVTLILSTGLQNIHEKNNTKYLIAPDNCRTIREEAIIGRYFDVEYNNDSSPWRLNREPSEGSIVITAKDGGSIFRQSVFEEVVNLDGIIRNVTVQYKGEHWKYKDLCVKDGGKCYKNSVLLLRDKIPQIISGDYSFKYPLHADSGIFSYTFYGSSLGGVTLDEEGSVKDAKSLRLLYFLNDASDLKSELSKMWLDEFLELLRDRDYHHIVVDRYSSESQEKELVKMLRRLFPLLAFSISVCLLFSIITCLKDNWIVSKPWTGIIAATSAGMALGSSFGLVIYFGVPLIAAVGSAPFLILGIGMDDTFVLLAAWRRTDSTKSVKERLSEAYSESAVSITITSLTNFVAFISGVATPFRLIRIFCIYASTAVLFSYIYQITFVGGCMAICGHLEKKQRHAVFGVPLKKANDEMGCCVRFFATSSTWHDSSRSISKLNFWEKYAKILTLWPIKVLSLVILFTYLPIGFWGITKLGFVTSLKTVTAYDSYYISYYDNIYKYFNQYRDRIQIVVHQEMDYSDEKVQKQIENLLTEIENTDFIADSTLTESWLRYFMKFVKSNVTSPLISNFNMSSSQDFIYVLRNFFLKHPVARRFTRDIAFNSNNTAIVASRFLCQTNYTNSLGDSYYGIKELREITNRAPFSVFAYHFLNFYSDEIEVKTELTIQILCSVAIVITVVCFLFIPNIITTLVVTCTVISIEASVLGYMALWDIEVGPVSIMILTMCAGFSVDYSAHMSYTYQLTENDNPNERMVTAISAIGMAIFQGSISTIICILPLSIPIAYIYVSGFKIIFLVILFSTIHSLFFLPILLSLFDSLLKKFKGKTVKLEISEEMRKNGNVNHSFVGEDDKNARKLINSNNMTVPTSNHPYFVPYSLQNEKNKL